jgi:hypothetical protein
MFAEPHDGVADGRWRHALLPNDRPERDRAWEITMATNHRVSRSNNRHSRYVGRVGVVAVALGVGMAVATGYGMGISRWM